MINETLKKKLFLRSENLNLKRANKVLIDLPIFQSSYNYLPLQKTKKDILALLLSRFSFSDLYIIGSDTFEKTFINDWLLPGQEIYISNDFDKDIFFDLVITVKDAVYNSNHIFKINKNYDVSFNINVEDFTPETKHEKTNLPPIVLFYISILMVIYNYQKLDETGYKSLYIQVEDFFVELLLKGCHVKNIETLKNIIYQKEEYFAELFGNFKTINTNIIGLGGIGSNFAWVTSFIIHSTRCHITPAYTLKFEKLRLNTFDFDTLDLHNLNRCISLTPIKLSQKKAGAYVIFAEKFFNRYISSTVTNTNCFDRSVDEGSIKDYIAQRSSKVNPEYTIDCRDNLSKLSPRVLMKLSYNGADEINFVYNPYKYMDMVMDLGTNPYEVHPSTLVPPILISFLGVYYMLASKTNNGTNYKPYSVDININEVMQDFIFVTDEEVAES